MSHDQDRIDRLYPRTTAEIAALRAGRVPEALARHLVGPLGPAPAFPLLLLLTATTMGLALGVVPYSLTAFWLGLTLALGFLGSAIALDTRHRRLQRRRARLVWLRTLSGPVSTTRRWVYGYGHVWYLLSQLSFQRVVPPSADAHAHEVGIGSGLGEDMIRGAATAYVAMIPSSGAVLCPTYFPSLVYLELEDGARIEGVTMTEPHPETPC